MTRFAIGTSASSVAPQSPPTSVGSDLLERRYVSAAFRDWHFSAALLSIVFALHAQQATAAPRSYAERMHARAVESFRHGRFAEAFGRFGELANEGHQASARYALWMCEQAVPLFGSDWDCTLEGPEWARTARAQPDVFCRAGGPEQQR